MTAHRAPVKPLQFRLLIKIFRSPCHIWERSWAGRRWISLPQLRIRYWLRPVHRIVDTKGDVGMNKQLSQEKGQALVLLVLGFVVLLGFPALAVDGGMVYSNRRHAQNASDASSLGGAATAALYLENHYVDYENWACTNSGDPIYTQIVNAGQAGLNAAISRAGSNDYAIDDDISDQNGATFRCGQQNTGLWIDKYLDITTTITTDTNTTFAHFVYKGPLRNTVTAVARVRPRSPLAFGNAVVALRTDCPNSNTGGVHIDGNSTIQVNGGGILSNACAVVGVSAKGAIPPTVLPA